MFGLEMWKKYLDNPTLFLSRVLTFVKLPPKSKQISNMSKDEKDDVGIGNEKLNVSLNI